MPSLEARLLQLVHERYRWTRPKPRFPYLTIGPHSYPQRPRVLRYGGDVERVDIGDYCSHLGRCWDYARGQPQRSLDIHLPIPLPI